MRIKGFIFSLDAFVAFSLVMITISMLIFTIGTPRPYYDSLEQAQQLAHDTLQVLSASTDNPSQGTYLEQIFAFVDSKDGPNVNRIMFRVAGGNSTYNGIIPRGYGFRLDKYQFNDGTWKLLYDSGNGGDSQTIKGCTYGSDRCGKTFTKLQASATTFASLYLVPPNPGKSPFCYLSCRGYNGIDNNGNPVYDVPCNTTPCDGTGLSNFILGNNTIAIARLTVYT